MRWLPGLTPTAGLYRLYPPTDTGTSFPPLTLNSEQAKLRGLFGLRSEPAAAASPRRLGTACVTFPQQLLSLQSCPFPSPERSFGSTGHHCQETLPSCWLGSKSLIPLSLLSLFPAGNSAPRSHRDAGGNSKGKSEKTCGERQLMKEIK